LLLSTAPSALAEPVSLNAAVEKAVAAAPLVKANEAAIAAAEAGKRRAGVKPNPVISAEAENFIGTGPIDILSQAELTVTYSQQIERGGKRAARVALADSDVKLAVAQAGVARLDIAAQVQRAYIDAQIASAIVTIAAFRLKTERDLQIESLRRVRGYKDPLFVETRAAARVAQAEIGLSEAETRYANALDKLAAFWGGSGDDVEIASGFSESDRNDAKLTVADEAVSDAAIQRANRSGG
jgi:cobalt-zinc-cadmium efflux system outer membrane protein